jgi:2-oxoglutarate dehydrogenase E1 component
VSEQSQSESGAEEFGANEWLVEELYEKFIADKSSVDESWWPTLEKYAVHVANKKAPAAPAVAAPAAPAAPSAPATPATPATPSDPNAQPVARTTSRPAQPTPIPADARVIGNTFSAAETEEQDAVTALKGLSKTLAANMDASLTVPTATSVRALPAKLMIDNRIVINNHLSRTRGGKVSFTHLIGWALIQALKEFPSQNVYYDEIDGKPSMVSPAHVTLGIAIDLPKPDGTRALMVPGIKRADTMSFDEFLVAYEDLVGRARNGKLAAEDFQGITMSLTNPGGIGTVHSVPRLMKGQGCIIGAGALEYPAEFQGSSENTLVKLGIGKIITLTSTYDHRVIQGAGSGEFLKKVHELLIGERGFFETIFADLRIPYKPIQWSTDVSVDKSSAIDKGARVQELINSYRVRGHLMADVDPLEYQQRTHPDLEIETHGLSFWDLDREFVTGGFGGTSTAPLRKILGILRDTYCRTIGLEYMHIQDPEQRAWIQEQVERPWQKPGHDEQMRILEKLNEAEAFETFLQTKYVGQKRFSLEGGESVIALLDRVLRDSATAELDGVAIGMAHRGRLNVLTNIAGKTYGQVFREFEGTTTDPSSVQGSGDVKYHLGTEGMFTSPTGKQVPVYLAANPSHLEAVNGVLQGIVRAKQDPYPIGSFTTVPVLIHGDASMAGQGVVYESLQMSQLRGYRIGGTVHIVINNQIGFTTPPNESRTSVYSTDVAKTIQAPIWHVNGDDPEAVARVAELAFEFRQIFKKDVVIDLVCYRRRGHNEGDDPSMTQPLMYNLIEAKRSVRRLYTESLVGRGDITQEEFDKAQADFQTRLEQSFNDSHTAQSELESAAAPTTSPPVPEQTFDVPHVGADVIARIGDAFNNIPEGFSVHPKLQQLLAKRVEMSRTGEIDWGFGELLAFGSVLLEGRPVRLTGQDVRRGTFVQRHAVFHDRENGREWLPLMNLSNGQGRFYIYDSLLSEYAVMAFEYGYSVERENALVLWEGQFGDFANGAQTVVDEFVSSAEQKWNQHSSVVLLLPHGYEGQGPDHSSARIERYLQMCAENNMVVARPSTPASYFHLLRRHTYSTPRRPLVVFTPKAMLRLRGASSNVEDFTKDGFRPIIDETRSLDRNAVQRVIITAGKPYHDLMAELEKAPNDKIAVVRMEQYYPAPMTELNSVLATYPNAEIVWFQDEPENQGAWPFILLEVTKKLEGRTIRNISRHASASPAAGSAKRHAAEAAAILERALTL